MMNLNKNIQESAILFISIGIAVLICSSCSLKPNEKIQNEAFVFSAVPKKTFKQIPGGDRNPAQFFAFDQAKSKYEGHKYLHNDSSSRSNNL